MKSVADAPLPKNQRLPHRASIFRIALPVTVDCMIAVMRLAITTTAIYWFMSGQHLWFIVGVVCAALTVLPGVVIRDYALRKATGLCVTTLLFAHIMFGMQVGLYETSTVYDKLMHVLGCSAITGLSIAAVIQYSNTLQFRLPLPLLLILVLGIVVGLGTMWEVFEFVIDSTGLFRTQRGLEDTMFDLIADTIGALATLAAYAGIARYNLIKLKHTS